MRVPRHWRSSVDISPHAEAATVAILAWFEQLGCSAAEIERARRFDIGGYVGIPFPTLDLQQTTRLGKYLALWLLWDDVDVEQLANGWRIEAADVLSDRRPSDLTRFHEGWWQLLQEFGRRRSDTWMGRLCRLMRRWSDAAAEEAALRIRYRETGELPRAAEQLELRMATIGMYGTACLIEDVVDHEAPPGFYANATIQTLQDLASRIVGLANDLFSFAKDYQSGQLNLVSTLMRESSLSVDDALAVLVRQHDDAVARYDELAAKVAPWAAAGYPASERWIRELRSASLGFGVWESQAPRYMAHQVVSDGRVLRPSFRYIEPSAGLRQARQIVVQ